MEMISRLHRIKELIIKYHYDFSLLQDLIGMMEVPLLVRSYDGVIKDYLHNSRASGLIAEDDTVFLEDSVLEEIFLQIPHSIPDEKGVPSTSKIKLDLEIAGKKVAILAAYAVFLSPGKKEITIILISEASVVSQIEQLQPDKEDGKPELAAESDEINKHFSNGNKADSDSNPQDAPSARETPEASSGNERHLGEAVKFNANILVVEDKITNQLVIKLMLQNLGCSVDVANNGLEALKAYDQKKHHLVFMDIFMPEMDGFSALNALKVQHGSQLCPVVALSANSMESDSESYIIAGFDDFLPKPYSFVALRDKMLRFLAPLSM